MGGGGIPPSPNPGAGGSEEVIPSLDLGAGGTPAPTVTGGGGILPPDTGGGGMPPPNIVTMTMQMRHGGEDNVHVFSSDIGFTAHDANCTKYDSAATPRRY